MTSVFVLLTIITLGVFMPMHFVFADKHTYIPISPLPGSEEIEKDDPGKFFQNIFKWFIIIAAMLSVIKLIICGFQYMLSESISSKGAAKSCIWAVLAGLALILLSVLILQTINPELTKLPFDGLRQRLQGEPPADGGAPLPIEICGVEDLNCSA